MTDYLNWRSKLSLEQVFAADDSLSYPSYWRDNMLVLSSLSAEKGRTVVKLLTKESGSETVHKSECITPASFSLRTKINEYGGKPYWLFGDELVFVNQDDQCLYVQDLTYLNAQNLTLRESNLEFEGQPIRVSVKPTEQERYFFSDVVKLDNDHYLCVVEHFESQRGAAQNQCFIGLVERRNPDAVPKPIVIGADFYSNLVMNADQTKIAWVQWNHPNMPWDENQLFLAELVNLKVENAQEITTDPVLSGSSCCQLMFAPGDELLFSVDYSNATGTDQFWNIISWNCASGQRKKVTKETLEFGYPHWQYGDSRMTMLDQRYAATIGSSIEGDTLFLIDTQDMSYQCVYQNSSTLQSLNSDHNGHLLAIELTCDAKAELVTFVIDEYPEKPLGVLKNVVSVASSSPCHSFPKAISKAKPISYSTRDGKTSHGFFYTPVDHYGSQSNAKYTKPPLMVMVHGGPTARAYGHYDVQKQYWASHGFSILDVNHRGSSGYGRSYRDALYGKWGDIDASDIVDGVEWLGKEGLIDPERVCIRGKSAGGYAVLRALTQYPEVFRAGACYYGIGNLATLAEITHKFEKHYTDRLLGEPYEAENASKPESIYFLRSPLNHIDNIKSDMIIFQGGEDKIVPPALAHEMVDALLVNNINHEYVEYPDEGHGFRQSANNIDAWTRELNFYRRALVAADL